MMEVTQDTPPELAPIFTYLNSHANKLYQEGYFLKLHDLDARTSREFPDSATRVADMTAQAESRALIACGLSALRNSLAPFSRSGTRRSSMRPARMARSFLPSLTSLTRLSKWSVDSRASVHLERVN